MGYNTFDTLFSTSSLQMLKVLFPLLPPEMRGNMAIFIRIMEFRQTLHYIQNCPNGLITELSPLPKGDALFDTVLPFCNETQRSELNKLKQGFEQVRQMQDMMEMAAAMKDLFPENANGQAMDPMQLFGMLSGMPAMDNPSSSKDPVSSEESTSPEEINSHAKDASHVESPVSSYGDTMVRTSAKSTDQMLTSDGFPSFLSKEASLNTFPNDDRTTKNQINQNQPKGDDHDNGTMDDG